MLWGLAGGLLVAVLWLASAPELNRQGLDGDLIAALAWWAGIVGVAVFAQIVWNI
jgi:hypothetical protein